MKIPKKRRAFHCCMSRPKELEQPASKSELEGNLALSQKKFHPHSHAQQKAPDIKSHGLTFDMYDGGGCCLCTMELLPLTKEHFYA